VQSGKSCLPEGVGAYRWGTYKPTCLYIKYKDKTQRQ